MAMPSRGVLTRIFALPYPVLPIVYHDDCLFWDHPSSLLQVPGIPPVDAVAGESLMTAIGLEAGRAQLDIGILAVFFALFNLFAFVLFRIQFSPRRRR